LNSIRNQQISHIALFLIMKHSIVGKVAVLDKLVNVYESLGEQVCANRYRELMSQIEQNGC